MDRRVLQTDGHPSLQLVMSPWHPSLQFVMSPWHPELQNSIKSKLYQYNCNHYRENVTSDCIVAD